MNAPKREFSLPAVPLFFWMAVFVGCPLVYVIVLSFLNRSASGGVLIQFTLDNYMRILDPLYVRIFLVSIGFAALTCLLTLAIGYPFAYFTARLNRKMRFNVLFLVVIPFWTSSLLRTYGWMILLRNDGIVNRFLCWLGVISDPVTLLYNYGAVLIGTVYMLLPLMILPVYNSVEKMDESLLEASKDLGAGRLSTFIHVTLPLTMPGVMGGVTLVFIPAVGLFFISDLMGGAKTMLIGNLVRNQMLSARDWPFGAALSIVMAAGVLLCLYLYRLALEKVNGGGVG